MPQVNKRHLSQPQLTSLSKRLIQAGIFDEPAALAAQAEAKRNQQPFLDYLNSHGNLNGDQLALIVAAEFGLPYLDLDTFDTSLLPKKLVAENLVRRHQVVPLYCKDKRLTLALATPTNLTALDEIQFQTNLIIHPVIVAAHKLHALIEEYLEADLGSLGSLNKTELEQLELEENLAEDSTLAVGASQDDAPLVKFVNKVLLDAVRRGASDIHFEPFEYSYRIRFRLDGILHEITRPPLSLRGRLAARIKVMARMDISERRVPQDGSIKFKVTPQRTLDFRVNTLPTLWGEKIVLRILDANRTKLGIEQLGFEPDQQALYEDALANPQGMILVTGPTGSGKTVTLYTGLNILNTYERNISSAEDPVEINVEGINQVNINPKVGLDFSAALRAFLRQDPDVVMVGEIRDLETAEIAIKAAQTGHLVLSTLHTNSAAATINRLHSIGIPNYDLASSIQLIIAQRLARMLCPQCKVPDNQAPSYLQKLGFSSQDLQKHTLYKPVGCDHCTLGYKGRVGIYEVVKIDAPLAKLILQNASPSELQDKAREQGYLDLRSAGRQKVLAGLTSITELIRVTME